MNDNELNSKEQNIANVFVKQNKDPIKIFQPKLLRIKEVEREKIIIPNLTSEYQKENKKLQKRIKDLNEMEKQVKEKQHEMELQRNLKSFYRNPFSYMDYLVKQYFREKSNLLENLDVKNQITNDFLTFCHEIQGKLDTFTQGELSRLKALEKKIEDKMRNNPGIGGGQRGLAQFDPNEPLSSMPIDQYPQSNAFFSNSNVNHFIENEDNKKALLFNILTRPDSAQMILNDKAATFHQEEIFKHALACLKGDTITPPKQSFLACDNISLEEIQTKDMRDSKRISTIKKKADWEEYIQAQLDPKYNYIDDPIHSRIKKQKSQEKSIFNKVLNESSKGIDKMNQKSQENEHMIDYVKTQLDKKFNRELIKVGLTKLSLYETNLNEIKNDLNKAQTNQHCVDLKERLELMDNEYNKTQKKIANIIGDQVYSSNCNQLGDDDIDKLYNKYNTHNNKNKSKKKRKINSKGRINYSKPKTKTKYF